MSDVRIQHLVDTLEPAATVRPTDDSELLGALARAARDGLGVWPLGGGHHVRLPAHVGRPWMWLDLRGHAAVLGLDRRSAVIHVAAGATIASVQAALESERLTLGPAGVDGPDTATVGGLLGRHWPWPSTFGTPTLRGACVGLTAHFRAEDGRYHYLPAPRKASGPDLRHLFVGGEGHHGVITEAWLAARRQPERDVRMTLRVDEPSRGARVVRDFLRGGALPWRCELRRVPTGLEIDVRLAGAEPVVALWTRQLTDAGFEASESEVTPTTHAPTLQLAGPWALIERALVQPTGARVTEVTAWGGRLELDPTRGDADVLDELTAWPWAARLDAHAAAPDTHEALTARLAAALDPQRLWLAPGTRS